MFLDRNYIWEGAPCYLVAFFWSRTQNSRLLPEFAKLHVLGSDLASLETARLTLKESLNRNNTVYHHSCSSKHNQQKLNRVLENLDKIKSLQNDIDIKLRHVKIVVKY